MIIKILQYYNYGNNKNEYFEMFINVFFDFV